MKKVRESLRHIDLKLFAALLVMGLCPTIYTTARTFWLGQLPGEWAYSIAGQLSWVNLLYEIVNEAIILPLYFFFSRETADRQETANRLKTGLLVSAGIYVVFAGLIMLFAEPMLRIMAASPDILTESAVYIRIESIANIFGVLLSFSLVALVSLGKSKSVYILTGAKLALCLLADLFFVSPFRFSRNMGVNGIGVSNILVNALLFGVTLLLLAKQGHNVFRRGKLSFAWMKQLARVGGISGAESLVRNVAYMLMVSRMVNMVGEQGTYWVANNFIWGWLLLPVIQLGELIKQETAQDARAVERNAAGYFTITAAVCVLWLLLIPAYKPFMRYVLNFGETDKLFWLVMVLLGFYVLYAFQNVFDCTFYGCGKTNYMLLESVVTNGVYYGTFFALYLMGVWTPTLLGIALMFGCGNAFDSIVSGAVYVYFRRKRLQKHIAV